MEVSAFVEIRGFITIVQQQITDPCGLVDQVHFHCVGGNDCVIKRLVYKIWFHLLFLFCP